MTDLLDLAERCERATGADRELDGWIYAHMTRGERYVIGQEEGRFPRPPIYGERLDVMRELTADPVGAADYIGAPRYTASIDAAMTLVPKGWEGEITLHGHVDLLRDRMRGPKVEGNAETSALALCAASLRARAGGEGK